MQTDVLSLRGAFRGKVALVLGTVAVGDWMVYQRGWWGGAWGILGIALVAAAIAAHPALRRTPAALIAAGFAAIYATAMLWSPGVLPASLFCAALAMAVLLPRHARFDDGWRWAQRIAAHAVRAIVGPVADVRRLRRIHRSRDWSATGAVLPLLAVPLIGTTVFLGLFAAANPVLANWIGSIGAPRFGLDAVGRALLWLVLAWAAWAVVRPRTARRTIGLVDGRGEAALPGLSHEAIVLSLWTFNAIFLIQNGMDAAWLWRLAPLPDGMTLAAYAHRGAYPLMATALLTALFVLVALRPGSTGARDPHVRRLVTAWVGQNLFLLANAAVRTIDYIAAYSLTVMRIAALLWLILVAIGLILVLRRMLADRTSAWLVNANLIAAILMLTGACFADLGAVAAWWNVRHAREVGGAGAPIDLCYLRGLGDAAVLPLVELERRPLPLAMRARVTAVRGDLQRQLEARVAQGDWSVLRAWRRREARRAAAPLVDPPAAPYGARCDGGPAVPPPRPPETRTATSPALTGEQRR